MNWTKEEIITEVLGYMDFSPSKTNKGMYSDNQGCWEDHTIEELIYNEVDNMDNYFQDKKTYQWLLGFCLSAKKLFNMGNDLDCYIDEYKKEIEND